VSSLKNICVALSMRVSTWLLGSILVARTTSPSSARVPTALPGADALCPAVYDP
jgi:hypothetical protein